MFALAKSLLILGRYLRRIAIALESIHRLYELELRQQGIIALDPTLQDEIEITYGPKSPLDLQDSL